MSPQLQAKLASHRAEAARLAEQLATLEGKLAAALAAEEYAVAQGLKGEIPPVREALALAQAQARALQDVLGQLRHDEDERHRAEEAEQRRRTAEDALARAVQAEQDATAEMARRFAEVNPTLDAARESLLAAIACEEHIHYARTVANDALVTLGQRGPGMYICKPADVTAKVERSPVLRLLQAGQWGQL